jgi:cytochrome c-type biogenesis protein CcmH/NrfG
VRLLRGAVLAVVLALAFWPEVARYRGERLLRAPTDTLRFVASHPGEVGNPQGELSRITEAALSAARDLPGDPRPWILAGSSRLVAGEPGQALVFYRRALALGERAETDLNIGRACEALGETANASAAFLRAVWVSPVLVSALLPDVALEIGPRLAQAEGDLKAGRLKAPPPPPE